MTPSREARMWGMICHLASFAGYVVPFGNVLGPLVAWMLKKDEHPFVNDQGKEALNFQMTLGLAQFALWLLTRSQWQVIALSATGLVFTVMGAIQANEGKAYRYPFRLRFLQ